MGEQALVKEDTTQVPAVTSDATAILQVIERAAQNPDVDIEKMERLLTMQERIFERNAAMEFNTAMTRAQSRMGRVATDASNKQTHSEYATYAALDKALRPIYTDAGFALSFGTADGAPPDFVRVICDVSHTGGHSKRYQADMPADGKGAKGGDVMTKTHAVGAGVSYGMRYLLKMIFNVAIGEDDTDGNAPLDSKAADWTVAIDGCATLDELHALKPKLVESYGGVDAVPKPLRSHYKTVEKKLK